jgi:hypothetical protein
MRFLLLLLILPWISGITAFAAPELEIVPDKIDFGRVPQFTKYFRTIVLKSVGDAPVEINRVNSFCDCIHVPITEATIAPGDSLVFEISFNTGSYSSHNEWRPHFYNNGIKNDIYLRLMADIVLDYRRLKPIYVDPHTIAASQFGDSVQRQFNFNIINVSSQPVPLKLIYNDSEYYHLDFPLYVLANDTAVGSITLNDKGVKNEFQKSITFEYIDNISEETKHYSIPVRRKIFKPKGGE